MAKCATCVYHEKDKRMENAWFLANHNEAKTTHFPCVSQTHGKRTYHNWSCRFANI